MATLFPDRHFHEGGDEISGADWKANSRVEEFMRTNGLMTLGELESYFFVRTKMRRITRTRPTPPPMYGPP
jgi:hexosaminidase